MTKLTSQATIKKLIKLFSNKFVITKESKNKFIFDDTYYSPDLVFCNKKNGKIVAVIEIEQGTRKHVVGGVITADYVLGLMKEKSIFCILGLTPQDIKDYKKRKKMIKFYLKNIKKVFIGDLKEIIKVLRKL